MSESAVENLEKQLKQLLGESVPNQAVYNINAAIDLAGILENKGFTFQLKDMCPKSMTETNWRATFSKQDAIFSAENPQSSVAVCMAAVDALRSLSTK
ncbi:hypothetical protein [uncultured Desulfobacter sp.]|uniref:hypothetical protein n=1 Tax=uncultured Desulfobacter sp. TaxID=240139 RepID=UPI0029F462A4|nr:hypothetical protein [uncultured Desulfobacter sp.]